MILIFKWIAKTRKRYPVLLPESCPFFEFFSLAVWL